MNYSIQRYRICMNRKIPWKCVGWWLALEPPFDTQGINLSRTSDLSHLSGVIEHLLSALQKEVFNIRNLKSTTCCCSLNRRTQLYNNFLAEARKRTELDANKDRYFEFH